MYSIQCSISTQYDFFFVSEIHRHSWAALGKPTLRLFEPLRGHVYGGVYMHATCFFSHMDAQAGVDPAAIFVTAIFLKYHVAIDMRR